MSFKFGLTEKLTVYVISFLQFCYRGRKWMIKMNPAPFDNVLEVGIQEKITGEDIHQFREFFMMKR